MSLSPERPARVRRVLVVEDEPHARAGLGILVGIEPDLEVVGTAASAEEALRKAAILRPDIVLLDNRLDGELTGLQAAPAFKQLLPSVVVLVCTAELSSDVVGRPGVDGYLCKDELVLLPETVRQLLGSA